MRADVVQSADVRMGQRRNRSRFATKPGAHLLIERTPARQDLYGHQTTEPGVCGAEDPAHTTGADKAFNVVRTQRGTRRELETSIEQPSSGCPDRPIQDDGRVILAQQGLDLATQRFVALACARQEVVS